MNFAVRVRHFARVWLDAQSVRLSAADALRLIESARFAERTGTAAFLPLTTTDAVGPVGTPRALLASPQADWQLALSSESIDLIHLPTDPTGANLNDLGGFAEAAAAVLSDCADFFGRVPHRLVLIQTGLLEEMPPDRMTRIARRLLNLPASFLEQGPFEWDWRCARHSTMRLDGRDEDTNILATLKRTSGLIQSGQGERTPFDRILAELEVNTAPADTRGRFRAADVRAFFQAAVEEHRCLDDELTMFMAGEAQ